MDELAAIVLQKNSRKLTILKEIRTITAQGMEGRLSFPDSLTQRLSLLNINKRHIDKLIQQLKKNISVSVLRNKIFFKKEQSNIYIISGGFKEIIEPIVKPFGIRPDHIIANSFLFDKKGKVIGYDKKNVLAQENGKVKAVRNLHLHGDIYMIGDGYTDYQLKQMKVAQHFIAFTENVTRQKVVQKADLAIANFDEFLYVNKLPRSISYPKSRMKAVLLENIHQDAVRILEKEGYPVEYYEKSFSEEELITKIENSSIVGIRSRTQLTPRVLNTTQRLLIVGAFCIGTEQIDIKTASQKGIAVFNAPYSNTRSVVELVIGEIIILLRRVVEKNNKLHQGIWDKSAAGSYEIRGKTLGIIGYGNIGTQLSVVAEALGMNVIFYDVVEKLALGNVRRCKTLEELLKKSDVVSVHVDGSRSNKNLICDREFTLMKKGVIFLNLSRGFVVNIADLVTHIKSGRIQGAAVDVFPSEPKGKDEPFVSELQHLPNVILTPHVGGSTQEAQLNIAQFVTKKIIDYINTGDTYLSVSLPQITLPRLSNAHRLLHIHRNIPGMLAQINNTLAKYGINIEGQYLKTNEEIGYAITDVNKQYDKKVLEALKQIPNTIRFRVLY